MSIRDLTDADIQKINAKLKNAGSDLYLNPKLAKDVKEILPKGLKLELDPSLSKVSNEALAKAAEGKVMRVEVMPLLTHLRKALKDATTAAPPEIEVGVQGTKLRTLITNVLNKQGFMLNISTVNDNYTKVIQQKLNGTVYTVKIHADAREIARSVQASLMNVQSRYFGLQVSKDILRNSIDQALMGKPFQIQIAVMHDQARRAVQNALNNARMVGKDDALAYQRLQTGELKAAQAELARVKAAHREAADAAKAHATASVNLGGAMGRNITIAGELGSAMASIYSIHAAKEFLSQVIEIGGELEHQKIAMDTIFGDKGKTGELFGQIKGLARQSPFGVMELTKSVKALSAYGVEYNEIYDTAKRLADISAATSVDINRLILAFGKTKSRGFLDGLEAKQFAYANIPIYEMVRKKLEELEGQAVTTADVMKRMKKREIGFDIVKDVLWDITDEGGKFYNMQEALAGSVKTSWKLVKDNIELMFGEIAESPVGDALKDVGVLLQGLTRNWRAIGAVLASAAVSLGVYKTAQLATNLMMERGVASSYKRIASTKMINEANLRAATSYRVLTDAESNELWASRAAHKLTGLRILSRKQLTAAEISGLYAARNMTKQELLHLVALRKVKAVDAERLLVARSMTASQIAETKAEIARAAAAKRSTVVHRQMVVALASVGNVLKSLFLNPWTIGFAAISAGVSLWQRNKEEMKKADEVGKGIFTKASEGADNLKQKLQELKPSEGLSNLEMERGIEDMIQTIKDYSPTPLKDINDALVAQDGHLLTIGERYDSLRKKVEALNASYTTAEKRDFGNVVSDAIKDTGKGWFNEDLNSNLKDYSNALQAADDRIREFSINHSKRMRQAVDSAMKADAGFREATKGMLSYEEKFKELMSLTDSGEFKYESSWYAQNSKQGGIVNTGDIRKSYNTAIKDYDRFVSSVMTSLRQQGISDISKLTGDMKGALAISFKSWLDGLDGVSDEVKNKFAGYLQKTFGVSVIEDDLTPQWVKAFQKLAKSSTDAATQQAVVALQTKGYNQLSAAEKKIIDNLIKQAGNDIAEQQPDLKNTVQAWFNSNPLMWQVTLQIQEATQGGIEPMTRQLINARGGFSGKKSVLAILNRWGKSGNAYGMRNAAQQDLQAAENELKAAEKLGKSTQAYAKAKAEFDDIKAAISYAEWEDIQTKDQKSNKHSGSGSQKDPVAESLRQRFKDIKDAWSEFQKWSKTEGREKAAARIGESGLFSTLPKDKIPQTVEQYRALVADLEKELRAAGIKGNARENLLNDLLKQLLDIDKTVVDEQLKLALDKVSKEAERQLADWNLYDRIQKATGNRNLAVSVAFGIDAGATTDYPSLVRKQFNEAYKAAQSVNKDLKDATFDSITPQMAEALPDELKKAWEDATKKLEQYARQQKDAVADILNEYQSLQDKLAQIDADRDRKIETVEGSTMGDADKQRLIQRINVEADYQKFTQSNEYLQFFAGIYALTEQEATRIGDLIEQNLNRRLQASTISAENYYKEIERIRQQLDKLRNVKSDALTYLTGGVKSLTDKRMGANDAERLKTIQKITNLEEELAKAKAEVKGIDDVEGHGKVMQLENQLNLAREELSIQDKIREKLIQNQQTWDAVLAVANLAANIAQGMSDAFNTLRDMADSFGFDTESNAWETVSAVMDTLTTVTGGVQKVVQSAMSGDIGGILSGVVNTITSPFTIWAQVHDKKLNKMIERSKEAAQIMQNQYDILEKRMANWLGNAADMNTGVLGGGYGKQRELMQGQLAELEKQRQAEIDKKKTDDAAVEDYNQQIEEMKITIRDFAMEAAKDLYGIDLNGWAEQLGDSLVDAFASGEDAAEAFDRTVGDIMRDVTSKMISQDILAPMFGDLRDYLFGANGQGGAFGEDFKLTPDEVAKMKEYMDRIKNQGIPAAQELYDAINEATGGILDDSSAKSGLSAGIQSVTEDTADLLASYVNAIRASVAMNETRWERLLGESLPQMSVIAQSQLDMQRQIAENTLRTAKATESLVKLSTSMEGSWRRIAMREWGYY